MKGVIRICIFGVLLTLVGCRSESLVEEEELYREQIDKIKFFENYEKNKNHRYDEEWLNYENTNNPAIPFSQSLKTLLVNRPEVAEIIKKHYGEIYWEATSRVIESKEGDKVVYYPIIGKGKDRNKYVLKSVVNKNHTYLRFEIQTKDKEELASQVLDNFAAYLSDNEVMESKCVDRNGIPTCDIDYVEIIRWKDRYVIKTPLPAFGYLPPANPPYYWDVGEGRYVGVECMNIGGCGESLPLPIPPMDNGDPCENNKKISTNPIVSAKNNELKPKLRDKSREHGYTFDRNTDGSINPTVRDNRPEGASSMKVRITPTTVGYNHTHPKGVKMFSPADIDTFVSIIRNAKRHNIPYNELFTTVVFDRDGKKYVYQMTYTGNGNDIPANEFTEEQVIGFNNSYMNEAIEYYTEGDGEMSIEDGYRLFMNTLKNMGLNNIQLADVSNPNNPIKVINNNGDPEEENCN